VKRYALSLKQPWAALLVHGLKTIEVRNWPTARRGKILIHAARVPDHRTDAWAKVPLELHSAARLVGGLVGEGELVNCVEYTSPQEFAADRECHLNDSTWFEPPRLYGFKFANLKPLPFRRYLGWMRFFPVEVENESSHDGSRKRKATAQVVNPDARGRTPPNDGHYPRLLVSVRSAEEAVAALDGGASIIDIKEPQRGSLGRADDATITAILNAVAGRKLVSAACGELLENLPLPQTNRLAYVKWGLANCGPIRNLASRLEKAAAKLPGLCRAVAVAYADWQRAQAPAPEAVFRLARDHRWGAVLIDTWKKDRKSLLDFLTLNRMQGLVKECQEAGIPVALAGSLNRSSIESLRPLCPAIVAVRGAVCLDGNRNKEIDSDRVRRLSALLTQDVGEMRRGHLFGLV